MSEPRVRELEAEVAELRQLFNMRWDADMRGIKRWQAAHPGNDLVWPDHADMVVWLLDQADAAARDAERLRAVLDFRASVDVEKDWHGRDLLRGIAFFLDRMEDHKIVIGNARSVSRQVQADLRRWADAIDAALAGEEAQGE